MQQLVEPNLGVVGKPLLCEEYVENVFGVDGIEPSAIAAWNDAKFKHQGTPPLNVSVPIFYSWQQYGHVALWNKGTIYTNPLSGTGHKTFSSIPGLLQAYGLEKYLGWSEDIAGLRVVKEGEDMATDQQIDQWISLFHQEAYGSAPSDEIFADWRKVLKNNFVDGSLSIMQGTDNNAGALKNKPQGNFVPVNEQLYKKG